VNPWIKVGLGTLTVFALVIVLSVTFLLSGDSSEAVDDNPPGDETTVPPTEPTAAAVTESVLVVSSPAIGDVVESPMQIVGESSQPRIGYRLFGGGRLLVAGTLADAAIEIAADGSFTSSLVFANTCCIEMELELFHEMPDGSEGLGLSIPLTYPETEPTGTREPGGATVTEIARLFQDAVNSRDAATVAELAPTASDFILDFLIGGGPYDTVDCYRYNGGDECRVINGIADFTFVVDVQSGLVTQVVYVGGA
jgi:hypothetical protein